jgi:hypothetical protein
MREVRCSGIRCCWSNLNIFQSKEFVSIISVSPGGWSIDDSVRKPDISVNRCWPRRRNSIVGLPASSNHFRGWPGGWLLYVRTGFFFHLLAESENVDFAVSNSDCTTCSVGLRIYESVILNSGNNTGVQWWTPFCLMTYDFLWKHCILPQ